MRRDPPSTSDEDDKLWQRFSKDIKPLKGNSKRPTTPPQASKKQPKSAQTDGFPDFRSHMEDLQPSYEHVSKPLTKRERRAKRQGKFIIEASIDLHGHTLDQAWEMLEKALKESKANHTRCLLVITGKSTYTGEEGRRLSEQVPHWLRNSTLSQYVEDFSRAKPEHGGEGALYVRVKKDQ